MVQLPTGCLCISAFVAIRCCGEDGNLSCQPIETRRWGRVQTDKARQPVILVFDSQPDCP